MRRLISSFNFIFLFLCLFSCSERNETIKSAAKMAIASKTIAIKNTESKNQGAVGFCWAYSFVGHLESQYLERTGSKINLSEEYIGIYHIFDQLLGALNSSEPSSAVNNINEGNNMHSVVSLFESYGAVPEQIFNKKFSFSGMQKKVISEFTKKFKNLNYLNKYRANNKMLLDDLGSLFGIKIPKDSDKFEFEGNLYDAHSFASKILGFSKDNYFVYTVLGSDSAEHRKTGFHYLKTALMNKVSVPVSTAIFKRFNTGAPVWSKDLCGEDCEVLSAHAMLATDFMTEGGKYGEISRGDAISLFNNEFSGVLVKNSWGKLGVNEKGEHKASGYNIIDRSYIDESINSSNGFQMILPKNVKNMLVGSGLKVTFKTRDYNVNEKITILPEVLDTSDGKVAEDISHHWKVVEYSTGREVFNSSSSLELDIKKEGAYRVQLDSTDGVTSVSVEKDIFVFGNERDLIDNYYNSLMLYNNVKVFKDRLEFFYSQDRVVDRGNENIVYLPKIKMNGKSKMKISFDFYANEKYFPVINGTNDNGKSLNLNCSYKNIDMATLRHNADCSYVNESGENEDVRIKIVTPDFESRDNLRSVFVFNPKLNIVNSKILVNKVSKGPYSSQYSSEHYNLYEDFGDKLSFNAAFSPDIESASLYINGKFIEKSFNSKVIDNDCKEFRFSYLPTEAAEYLVEVFGSIGDSEVGVIRYFLNISELNGAKSRFSYFFNRGKKINIMTNRFFKDRYKEGNNYLTVERLSRNNIAIAMVSVDLTNDVKLEASANLNVSSSDRFRIYTSYDNGNSFNVVHESFGKLYGKLKVKLNKKVNAHKAIVKIELLADQIIAPRNGMISNIKLVK